jgi:hypothetical protein
MPPTRPFTDPTSVSLAGIALLILAAASFTSSLSHQLRQPRPDDSATVVVVEPKDARLSSAYDVLVNPEPARPGAPNVRPHAQPAPAARAADALGPPADAPEIAASAADHATATATAATAPETAPEAANAAPSGDTPVDPEVAPPPSPTATP